MNAKNQENKRTKLLWAGLSGVLIGGISGALIGYSFSGSQGAVLGVIVFGFYLGITEAITDWNRKPGELKPAWHRLINGVIISGAFGALLGLWIDNMVILGLLIGLLAGLASLSPKKLLLALVTGLFVSGGLSVISDPNPALVGALVAFVYRILLGLFFRDSPPLTVAGERVPASDARYVVPFDAHTKYIGAEFMETLARESDGTFKRNKAGIGIVASLDALGGPTFEPARVDPLIREFYEHTSRFKLSIIPEWNPLMKPFFWFFKTYVAQPIGQANLPFNTEEAQRGMVSYIDTIDYRGEGGEVDAIKTLRGWIRAYEDSGEAIYVGIYTVVRHENAGYVSVGFPLPEANFTATLLPYNSRETGLLLKTQNTGSQFPGHYLTYIDKEDQSLTILKMPAMGEEIDVYVKDEQLVTEHRFFFGQYKFLMLHYSMERLMQEGDSG